jgi:hypothetical protein
MRNVGATDIQFRTSFRGDIAGLKKSLGKVEALAQIQSTLAQVR